MKLIIWFFKAVERYIREILPFGLGVSMLFCFSTVAWPQRVITSLEPKEIFVGQHASFHIRIELPGEASLIYPAFSDTITRHIEIIRFGRPDTLLDDAIPFVLEQIHVVTSWDEGFHPIPPINITAIAQGDTLRFSSEALLLEVKAVEVDVESDIRDIKSIFRIPLSFRELLPYLVGLLAIALIVSLLIRHFKKGRLKEQKFTIWEKPDIPAHMAAFSRLSGLKSRKLWQAGQFKLYHSELTNIIRLYLEKRYGIGALELTTSEIMTVVEPLIEDSVMLNNLRQILEVADLVKFAKFIPEASLNEASMELAFDFVDGTKKIAKDAV